MTRYIGFDLFDGATLHPDMALEIEGGILRALTSRDGAAQDGPAPVDLSRSGTRALLSPGLVDLQVNGGAGHMIGVDTTAADIIAIARAHWQTGTATLLPTLISDTPETTARVIRAVAEAQAELGPEVIAGLHLEGPHLAVAGAHDPAKLRPMTEADLHSYTDAKSRLGALMVTLAPEIVPPDAIRALSDAGITVALGHSGCDYATACAAFEAGAHMATHLFNAMSGLHHREPGLVGAVLDRSEAFGLIADGHHVHPAAIRTALRAAPGRGILVSDAMALAGTDRVSFLLADREVRRDGGRLTLADGTLAGADLTLTHAVENIAGWTGKALDTVLPMAIAAPLAMLGLRPRPIAPGDPARFVIWRDGRADGRLDGQGVSPLHP